MPTPHSISHLTVKKKFLLANKHITKSAHAAFRTSRSDSLARLNSTLSLRIEELNAQISALHVENLRLRASEIALGTQLKKEREKSQRIIADAESAVSPHFHPLSTSQSSGGLYDVLFFITWLFSFHSTGRSFPNAVHETLGVECVRVVAFRRSI